MPLSRIMLSSAQRCSEKRLVMAPPSASASANPPLAASAVPVRAADEMKLRRFMVASPLFLLERCYTDARRRWQPCGEMQTVSDLNPVCSTEIKRLLQSVPPKHEIVWHPASTLGLCFIAGCNVARPRRAPLGSALSGPDESRSAQKAFECPRRVVGNVGCEMHLTARPQHPCQGAYGVVLNDAALPVTALGPRIGIKDINTGQRIIGEPVQQLDRIAEMKSDVANIAIFDCRQHLGHAVDERFAADEAGAWTRKRLRGQVLAAAKADFELYGIDRVRKERLDSGGWCTQIDREAREQACHELRLAGSQRMPLAAAEEREIGRAHV